MNVLTDPNRALEFPTARRDPESGYTLHGRRFEDPYAWLERLEAAETQAWLTAQEAVTHAVLRSVPGREGLRSLAQRAMRGSCRRFPPGRTDASFSGPITTSEPIAGTP